MISDELFFENIRKLSITANTTINYTNKNPFVIHIALKRFTRISPTRALLYLSFRTNQLYSSYTFYIFQRIVSNQIEV
jgi:hypothetical protein